MIRLITIEVYNSLFNLTKENIEFDIYTDNFHKLSFAELKDEPEQILSISDITPSHLQLERI